MRHTGGYEFIDTVKEMIWYSMSLYDGKVLCRYIKVIILLP